MSLIVASAAIVSLGTACGGDSSGNDAGPGVLGKTFHDRVTAVCRSVLSQKRALGPFPYPDFNPTQPDLSKLPSIARLEAKTVQIYDGWVRRLDALGQPQTGQSAWSNVLEALKNNARAIADQQAAGERRDGETFTRDYYEGNKFQTQLEDASDAAGLPACAEAAAA